MSGLTEKQLLKEDIKNCRDEQEKQRLERKLQLLLAEEKEAKKIVKMKSSDDYREKNETIVEQREEALEA